MSDQGSTADIPLTKQEIFESFYKTIEESRSQLEECGCDLQGYKEDIATFAYSLNKVAQNDNIDPSLREYANLFQSKYFGIFGDLMAGSEIHKKNNPMKISITYEGLEVWGCLYNPYYGLSKIINYFHQGIHHLSFSSDFIAKYIDGDAKAEDYLTSLLQFQGARNWNIIYCHTKIIHDNYPSAYEKMMKSGKFLSIEEIKNNISGA
jgi:hypothetical protein